MATETRTFASIGSAGSWVASSGTLLAAIQTADDGTYGIEPTGTSAMYGVPVDFAADAGETVNSITIRAQMRMAGAGDSCSVANQLRISGGVNTAHPDSPLVNSVTFAPYEWVWATQPGGAPWTVSAANNIIRCYLDPISSGGPIHCDRVDLIMDYGGTSEAHSGGSTVIVPATTAGQGTKANAGGSTTAATAASTGAGVAGRIGGTTITVTTTATGAGAAARAGGSTAMAAATASGAGTAGYPPRDLRITNTSVPMVGWNGQPLTVGWPTTGPALAAWLTGQPTPTWNTTAPSTATRTATAPATDAFTHTPPATVWTTTAPTL